MIFKRQQVAATGAVLDLLGQLALVVGDGDPVAIGIDLADGARDVVRRVGQGEQIAFALVFNQLEASVVCANKRGFLEQQLQRFADVGQ